MEVASFMENLIEEVTKLGQWIEMMVNYDLKKVNWHYLKVKQKCEVCFCPDFYLTCSFFG
jgi:hypothetical protein